VKNKPWILIVSVSVIGTILVLMFFLLKFGILIPMSQQKNTHISLTVGVPLQLHCDQENVSWYSDNPFISVNELGVAMAKEDKMYPGGQGTIQALTKDSNTPICTYAITVVPWAANESKIEILGPNSMIKIFGYELLYPNIRLSTQYILPSIVVHGNIEGWIYYSINRKLYKTKDNFQNRELVSHLPFRPGKQRVVSTPFGYFLRGKKGVYYSEDFKSWDLSLKTNHPAWLLDNMDYWYDVDQNKAFIYVSEYSVIAGETHLLYKGTIDSSRKPIWETAFTVVSELDLEKDSRNYLKAARHIHLVKVDPFTGDVWFGTGDLDNQAMICRSSDHGKTFQLVGTGSQEYRTLGFWFTENYVYWNMDKTFPDQLVFRIKRSDLKENGMITPILKSGKTKIGVDYFVYSANSTNYFPAKQGQKFTEYMERAISEENQVLAVNDPGYDKKELVANLTNGSHWSVFDVKTDTGETVTLLTTTAEGFHRYKTRDVLGRVFGIHENKSGSVTVTELLNVAPYDSKSEMARLEAIAQADDGTIYFQSFNSIFGGSVVAGSLKWNNPESLEFTELDLEFNQ